MSTSDSPTRVLARFAAGLGAGDPPPAARARARQCLADTVGVASFGAELPWSRMIAAYARRHGGGGACSILDGGAAPVSAPLAALANGALAHAFELDSLRKPGAGVHPGAVLTAAALAVGEQEGASGAAVITAFVAGAEVMGRIGLAARHSSERLGFHAPGLTGVFGSAVTAGRLLALDGERMANALGIAASLCSGLLAFSRGDGGMVKRLHLGRAAEGGVLAASLAAEGFTGPTRVLEGELGFLHAYAAETAPERLTQGLGEHWETTLICAKAFPCHIAAHTPVAALQALRGEHGFAADDVQGMVVGVSAKARDRHAATAPADVAGAQYSVPYSLALALHRDPGDPRAWLDGGLDDDRIRAAAARVRLVPYDRAEVADTAWSCRLELTLRDGRRLVREQDDFPGAPSQPLDADAGRRRFLRLAASRGEAPAEALFERLQALERCDDVRELVRPAT